MSDHYRQGDQVKWKWGANWAHGKIAKMYTRRVTLRIKGNDVTRNGTDDEPAYKVEQDDGDQALKNHSELRKA